MKTEPQALREEDVQVVDHHFRAIAEYLEKLGVPGTVWRIMTKNSVFNFVCKKDQRKP